MFGPIAKPFRNLHYKVNFEIFGSKDSVSPGQKYSGHGNGFAVLSTISGYRKCPAFPEENA